MSIIVCNIEPIAQMTGHKSAVFALEADISDNSYIFYAGDGDGWIVCWDIRKPELGRAVAKVPSNIFSICLTNNNNLPIAVVGTLNGNCFFLDLQQNSIPICNLMLPKTIFAIKPHHEELLFCCGDGQLYVVKPPDATNTANVVKKISFCHSNLRNIAINSQLSIAAIGSSNGLIYIISLSNFSLIETLSFHKNSVFSLAFSPCGNYLLSGSRDAQIAVWQYDKQQQIFSLFHIIPAHWFTVNCIAYTPDGQVFASASRDKTVKIWHSKTFQLLKVIDTVKYGSKAPIRSANTLLWLPSTENDPTLKLIISGDDRNISAWRISV